MPGYKDMLVRDFATLIRPRTLVHNARIGGRGGRMKEFLTDMTMQKPHPWIIGLECDSQVASSRQQGYVSSWGIVEVEGIDARGHVILGYALS